MPLVEKDAEVTLVVLIYKSLRWLDFCMEGVKQSQNETRYRWCVVANDATEEVKADPRITVDWENENTAGKIYPHPDVMAGIYRAWNEGVLNSPTQWCILMNSDMLFSDWAIDELFKRKIIEPKTLPCSLLIENGRIPSAMPDYVRDFGTTPDNFRMQEFRNHADTIRDRDMTEAGRLFMPVLFDRQEFMDMGGYPEGNVNGISGDRILFNRYVEAGYEWVTCMGSVVAHLQEGEVRDES